mgnify:CR=1 FL=1
MVKKKNKEKKSERKKEGEESEEKIDETKEDSEEEPKIVESFLKSIPLFGDFFKELGKTEVFKKRFEEANKQIQENLQKGERKGWGFQAHISTRPIIRGEVKKLKEEESAVFYGKDYWYMKKGNMLALAVKVPGKNIQIELEDKKLILKDKGWEKIISLPDKYRTIREKQYKKNNLALKLTK